MGRGDLSDEQWAVLEQMLPVAMRGRPAVASCGMSNAGRLPYRTAESEPHPTAGRRVNCDRCSFYSDPRPGTEAEASGGLVVRPGARAGAPGSVIAPMP
ncbi:hypothetical protein E4U92_26780 [Streptomyces galbus]|uniref:Uncharacterized protein n=1 Tax=Streptomyces galbus TaxID=33898 RepID=A0A4U5WVZ8_STRGB|nr:hypothetical protein E4U92_26780 [Streptomyces galbus]